MSDEPNTHANLGFPFPSGNSGNKQEVNNAQFAARLQALDIDATLRSQDEALRRFRTDPTVRQPIHTVYIPAQSITENAPEEWGTRALRALSEIREQDLPLRTAALPGVPFTAPPGASSTPPENEAAGSGATSDSPRSNAFGSDVSSTSLGRKGARPDTSAELPAPERQTAQQDSTAQQHLTAEQFEELLPAVRHKLKTEPIEDLRIDLEDGFDGIDEDKKAKEAALLVSSWLNNDVLPFCGIRIKSFSPETRARSLRTLGIVLDNLDVPAGRRFRLTFPKVTSAAQVEALMQLTDLPFEIQFETPQAVLHARTIRDIAADRCLAFHYGTYDYSAAMGIDPHHQAMDHPVADFAKDILQLVTAETPIELSDGSTNFLPVGDHKHAAWANHFRLVRRHLARGIRQGWDLHPYQLPTRYLATYSYFREYSGVATERLKRYVNGESSEWMDEPATAKALASYLLRASSCGAVSVPFPIEDLYQLARTGRLKKRQN